MSEMVERVARALCRASRNGVGCSAEQFTPYRGKPFGAVMCGCGYWERHVDGANAAIAAMREPTDAMKDALQSYAVCAGFVEEGWAAAMEEALK